MTPQHDLPKKGDLLAGKYQVEEVLGAGGMGVVVAARHIALRQRVALKFLLPAAMKLPGASARFLREAQAAAAIQSEHVARVLDVGTLETGAPYMVMEHLSGADLARHLKDHGKLPLEEAVDFVLQASEALAEAHALGIVHRDLKPGNLFLSRRPDGSPLVKVLDFGLSKMTLADDGTMEGSLTATNVVAGSPYYMSPEQVRSLKHVDARTDVWALGVILYELLTGRRPFEGATVTAVCASVAADKPAPPRRLRPELPEPVEALILACLEKDPDRRLPSVAHLASGLAPFALRRSEPAERISRILPRPVDLVDAAVTVPWQARPSQPDAPPPVSAPDPPRAPLPSAPGALERGDVPPSSAGAAAPPTFGLPPVPPVESPSSARRLLPSVPEPPSGAAAATGPVGWGHTSPPVQRRRIPLVPLLLASSGLVLALGATVIGVVLSRGAAGARSDEPVPSASTAISGEPSAAPPPAAAVSGEPSASVTEPAADAPAAAPSTAASSSPSAAVTNEEPPVTTSTQPAPIPAPKAWSPAGAGYKPKPAPTTSSTAAQPPGKKKPRFSTRPD